MPKRILRLLLLLFTIIHYSCDNGNGTAVEEPEYTFNPTVRSSIDSPYLDIREKTIYNTSALMEYSQDGGDTWNNSTGGIQKLEQLDLNDHILLRENNDEITDLGTVTNLQGKPDLIAAGKIYAGISETQGNKTYWDDEFTAQPGEIVTLSCFMENLGEEGYAPQRIEIVLSDDRIIDTDTDTVLASIDYNYRVSIGLNWIDDIDYTLPLDLQPGTYYIGLKIDTQDNLDELNNNNNSTLPEDMTPLLVSDSKNTSDGAFKVVNSWGVGIWENKADGHYWMPYEVLKNNQMAVFFYFNDFERSYQPTALAVFKLDHPYRNQIKVTFGIGNPLDPLVVKAFEPRSSSGQLYSGAQPFPSNSLVLDISELAAYLNDGNLYMQIENSGSTEGIMNNFSLELYDGSSTDPFRIMSSISVNSAFPRAGTERYRIETENQLSQNELQSVTPVVQTSSTGIRASAPGSSELSTDIQAFGIYEEGKDYNQLWKGRFGTGYRPPRQEELEGLMKIRSIDTDTATVNRAVFDGSTLPDEVDNSITPYFPPIGDQGGKGSCVAFSVGYYIQTYTEAKERNWDLSSTIWGSDITGVSEAGSPQDNLDKIFSPDFIYPQVNNGEDNGSWQFNAIEVILRQGGATWATTPYRNRWDINPPASDYTTWPTEEAWREAPQYRGDRYGNYYWDSSQSGYFIIEDDGDIQMLKTLLSMGYIVSTNIDSGAFFGTEENRYNDNQLNSKDVLDASVTWIDGIDHAQTVVGYKEGTEWDPNNPDA